jgi:glycosyltransferase involved in cell wall biosynthesis
VPTLFEAASGPVAEAWNEGVPVACSDIPQLREQAGGAAIFFNPFDPDSIASAIVKLCTDDETRNTLTCRGREVSSLLSWERTALAYRQLYRDTAAFASC